MAAFLAAGGLSFLLIFERQGRLPAARGVPALGLRMVIDGAMGIVAFYVLGGAAGATTIAEIVRGVAAGIGFEAVARNRTPPFSRVPYEAITANLDSKIYAHGASRDFRELNRYLEQIVDSPEVIADKHAEWLDFNRGLTNEEVSSILREIGAFVQRGQGEDPTDGMPRNDARRRRKALVRQILKKGHGEFLAEVLDG